MSYMKCPWFAHNNQNAYVWGIIMDSIKSVIQGMMHPGFWNYHWIVAVLTILLLVISYFIIREKKPGKKWNGRIDSPVQTKMPSTSREASREGLLFGENHHVYIAVYAV